MLYKQKVESGTSGMLPPSRDQSAKLRVRSLSALTLRFDAMQTWP